MQAEHRTTAERLGAFSDAVIAVIITIMVLELKAPEEEATFSALLPLWPTAVSYAISYLFIAIIWLNHHHQSIRGLTRACAEFLYLPFEHSEDLDQKSAAYSANMTATPTT